MCNTDAAMVLVEHLKLHVSSISSKSLTEFSPMVVFNFEV